MKTGWKDESVLEKEKPPITLQLQPFIEEVIRQLGPSSSQLLASSVHSQWKHGILMGLWIELYETSIRASGWGTPLSALTSNQPWGRFLIRGTQECFQWFAARLPRKETHDVPFFLSFQIHTEKFPLNLLEKVNYVRSPQGTWGKNLFCVTSQKYCSPSDWSSFPGNKLENTP